MLLEKTYIFLYYCTFSMRPQYAMRDFSLLTMYPTKELTEDKTIEETGLKNATIMQRLK